jgi:hypothetical protein
VIGGDGYWGEYDVEPVALSDVKECDIQYSQKTSIGEPSKLERIIYILHKKKNLPVKSDTTWQDIFLK